jgi:hypothetical protein
MIEPKPVGYVQAKMAKQKASPLRQQALEARKAFYAATRQIDAITRAGGDPEAIAAALAPFLEAAKVLPVRDDDTA